MTAWDFANGIFSQYGILVILLVMTLVILIFISFMLIKWIMIPMLKKFLSQFDILKDKVDQMNDTVIRLEDNSKSTSERVELIAEMNEKNITEIKVVIIELREEMYEISKTINKMLKEHYRNHPQKHPP